MPSDGIGEALPETLPVAADGVVAARERERREKRAAGMGDVQVWPRSRLSPGITSSLTYALPPTDLREVAAEVAD